MTLSDGRGLTLLEGVEKLTSNDHSVTLTPASGTGIVDLSVSGGGGAVNSVTGLNTDNADPANPVVKISVDNSTITGLGTPGSPLIAVTGGGGTVTTTGSPASGNISKFSGATSITNGDLSGDATTSGTLVVTVVHAPASGITGTTLASNVVTSSLTVVGTLTSLTMGGDIAVGANNITMTGSLGATGARLTKGWFTDLQVTNAIAGSVTGNAATATALQNARTIGGVSFDGTANIVPQTIQSVNEATDTTCFPLFISASGSQSLQPLNNTNLTFNSNTGAFGSTSFSGAGTGLTGTAASLTAGNVTTNANLTGAVTSSGNATTLVGALQFSAGSTSAVGNQTFYAMTKAAFSGTINSILGAQTTSGTITLAVKINGTNVTGLSAVAVTSTPGDTNASAANTFVAGDAITWVTSSASTDLGLSFTMKITRT